MRFSSVVLFLALFYSLGMAQSGEISGYIKDATNNEAIEFANIYIPELGAGEVSDASGFYQIKNVPPGYYTIQVSYVGYQSKQASEIEVTSTRPTVLDFELESSTQSLGEVVVKADAFQQSVESPLSLRNIGITEIKRNPGGNRDISVVIRSFPGVTSTASFRNDLIIRGGSPNENRFYLDEVEVPTINHFATQGASGGPASILNVDFIKEVDFFSGAFPANRPNALSSVFNFRQKDGRSDKMGITATIGATDIGATLEGPIGEKTTFLLSARRSYLQFLFAALELPFLPTYNDFNLKVKTKLDEKNEITFIGVGAIDDFELNLDANETESQRYILNQLPDNSQWNYTNGLVYKRYGKTGYYTVVLSRNMIQYQAEKYLGNDKSDPDNLNFRYQSREAENHFRLERTERWNDFKLNVGLRYDYARYENETFNKIYSQSGLEDVQYNSQFDLHAYGAFGQLSRSFFSDKLDLSAGFSISGQSYSSLLSNPLDQFSPRFSASYEFLPRLRLNVNTGLYYQLPPYTALGYRQNGNLVNKDNGIVPIQAAHFVAGFSYLTGFDAKISLEGYYKEYDNYPILTRDSISLANLGGDFGVVGNGPVVSEGQGRTYGMEVLFQQRLFKGFYGLMAYTLGWSEFTNKGTEYVPSSWDARHIVSLTMGKQFGKYWELGVKWRYQSGLPRSPFDPNSDLVSVWDRNQAAFPDYSRINTLRAESLSEIDFRIDKKWYFEKWSLDLYLDVRNILGGAVASRDLYLDVELDDDGLPIGQPEIVNPNAPVDQQRYKTKFVSDDEGTPLPTIGVVVRI